MTDGSPEQSSSLREPAARAAARSPSSARPSSARRAACRSSMGPVSRSGAVPRASRPELITSTNAYRVRSRRASRDWCGLDRSTSRPTEARTTINLLNIDIPAGRRLRGGRFAPWPQANGATLGKVVSLPLGASDATLADGGGGAGQPRRRHGRHERAAVRPGRPGARRHRARDQAVPAGDLRQPADAQRRGLGDGRCAAYRRRKPQPLRHQADPYVATYRRVLDTYPGDKVPLSQFAGNVFTAVMNLKVVD